jgi:hypothetical protein
MFMPRDVKAGVPQGSVLSFTLCNLYVYDIPQTTGVSLALFVDDTSLYATEHKEGCSQKTPVRAKFNGDLL